MALANFIVELEAFADFIVELEAFTDFIKAMVSLQPAFHRYLSTTYLTNFKRLLLSQLELF